MLKYRLKVAGLETAAGNDLLYYGRVSGDTEFLDVAPVFCDVIEAALAVFSAIRPLNGGIRGRGVLPLG